MKLSGHQQSLEVHAWVNKNQELLNSGRRGTMTDVAATASKDLGFKVSTNKLKESMQLYGIETRRIFELVRLSKRNAVVEALEAENARLHREICEYKTMLAKVLASQHIPEDLKDYILAGLPQQMRDKLKQEA